MCRAKTVAKPISQARQQILQCSNERAASVRKQNLQCYLGHTSRRSTLMARYDLSSKLGLMRVRRTKQMTLQSGAPRLSILMQILRSLTPTSLVCAPDGPAVNTAAMK
jgi:hypothetical protein